MAASNAVPFAAAPPYDNKQKEKDSKNRTAEEQVEEEAPRTAERTIVRPERAKRKLLLKLMLRPTRQTESKNKKSRRLRIDDILECEGDSLDPGRWPLWGARPPQGAVLILHMVLNSTRL